MISRIITRTSSMMDWSVSYGNNRGVHVTLVRGDIEDGFQPHSQPLVGP